MVKEEGDNERFTGRPGNRGMMPGMRGYPRSDFLTRRYRTLFIIPFLLILLSVIIMGASNYPNGPDPDDYDHSENYQRSLKRFNNIIDDVQNTANIMFTTGILFLAFLFFMAPFIRNDMHIVLRIALLAVGLLIITNFLNDGLRMEVIFG